APQAEIDLILVPDLSDVNIFNAEQFVVNSAKLPVVNESLGECEEIFSLGFSEQIVFFQAVAEGIAFFASSGDEGAEFSPGNTPGRAEINCPACYEGVTAVGGTEIDGRFDSNNNLIGINLESVWNEPPGISTDCDGSDLSGGAGGGGFSRIITKPSYQISAGGFPGGVPDGQFRAIPDVAMLGGPPAALVVQKGKGFLIEG